MTALVWCPFPDRASAQAVAERLLEERLIACANLVDGMTSVFRWQGSVDSSSECGALFKTDASRLEDLVCRIAELHPYETPAVVGWPCPVAASATRDWIDDEVVRKDRA